jgi:hypothetical protein
MGSFVFKAEFEEGRSVEIVPSHVVPFGAADIERLENDPGAALQLQLHGDDLIADGLSQPGRATVKAKVTFHRSPLIYALVPGGWVPLPFTEPPRFLVDRNVVISLRKIREGRTVASSEALDWWTRFFRQGTGIFNPLLFAYEGAFQRKPTMAEFVSAYEEGVSELTRALPECHVVTFADEQYRAAYQQLEAFDERNGCEISFLQAACPLVAQRVSRREEVDLTSRVLALAQKCNVSSRSLVLLAALSCVYENIRGTPLSIGRRLLKPRIRYFEQDAFNALSDLRHIELAAAGQLYLRNQAFSLCTCDRALALMWAALSPRGESRPGGPIDLEFDLTRDLFARLDDAELLALAQRLAA